ncbi:MAG: peptidylprolyl isomerase [Gammaproteobacteria bacterium]|nr:peptidylprolyl isomerase [Gammaproteobacteria bacterium]
MQIRDNTVVSIDYVLTDAEGEVLDRSEEGSPLAYLQGARNIIPGLEKALVGHETGDSVQVEVNPEEGYGQYDQDLVQVVSRDLFEDVDALEPGMRFQAKSDSGSLVVTVTEVSDNGVTVDGNHPLAGQTLNFDVTVTDVREATDEEIEHGHVHT